MGRRLRIYRIAPEMLPCLFGEGSAWRVSANGMPADARVVGVHAGPDEFRRDEIALKVESASFAEVAEGHIIPDGDPVAFTRIDA